MKKAITPISMFRKFIMVAAFLICLTGKSLAVVLYGIAQGGGASGEGVIYSFNTATRVYTIIHDLTYTVGQPTGLILANNGLLYGVVTNGTPSLVSLNPVTGAYNLVWAINNSLGYGPVCIIQASNGLLYGVTNGSGGDGDGVLFSFDISSNSYTELLDISSSEGSQPCGIMQSNDGSLYITMNTGGVNNNGSIINYVIDSNYVGSNYIGTVMDMGCTFCNYETNNGPTGTVLQAKSGTFYCTTAYGSTDAMGPAIGGIFSFSAHTAGQGNYNSLYDFSFADNAPGNFLQHSLTQAPNGVIYGMTNYGGTFNEGYLYSFDTVTNTIDSIVSFNGAGNGAEPAYTSLYTASDGLMYCAITQGGAHNAGTIFSFDYNTNTLTKLYDFDSINGSGPLGRFIEVSSCTNQCVWPGDANWDGVVNNLDLLPIGIAYADTGIARADTSITWYGHTAANWTDSLQDSINYKFIDCNGNGVINVEDAAAIIQNYSLTYTRGSVGYTPARAGISLLTPQVMQDTVYNNDTLIMQFMLGDSANPANNVYGVAFTLNYDATVVDTSQIAVTFGNSWLGTAAAKISLAKNLTAQSQLACAVTRIDHTTRSGEGSIGNAIFKITTDNLNGKDYAYYNALFYISGVTMIDSAGNILQAGAGEDSARVAYFPTGIKQVKGMDNAVLLYPNPASNKLFVSSAKAPLQQIKIIDVLGKQVILQAYPFNTVMQQQLDITNLANGIYMVEALTENGVVTQKLVIER